MQPLALRFQHVTKRNGATQVVCDLDLDLEISSGEFFGLVGMNGAGKTTQLIKYHLDFTRLTAGNEYAVTDLSEIYSLRVSPIPQEWFVAQSSDTLSGSF